MRSRVEFSTRTPKLEYRADKITNYELRITNCQLREPYGSPLYIK